MDVEGVSIVDSILLLVDSILLLVDSILLLVDILLGFSKWYTTVSR